jgi:hypothetical protein
MTKCSMKCEVYTRVCGYMRPVKYWNKGKKSEFNDRKTYKRREHETKNVVQRGLDVPEKG